jgi:8-oxo-dGTP pyrophosphatase MutT (NUDIX family)
MPQLKQSRKRLADALTLIPSHRETHAPIAQLALKLARKLDISDEEARGAMSMAVAVLDLLGMLQTEGDAVRMSGQLPVYFARSLGWFARHGVPMIDGWRRDGVPLTTPLAREQLLDHAPHVLSAIEARRIRQAIKLGLNAEASRDQSAVVVLIRDPAQPEPAYLHQFDARADQFQLIGGRMEPGETILMAAKREIFEELGPASSSALQPDVDYSLSLLYDGKPALVTVETSHTYGALTRYTFYGCAASWQTPLQLGPHDRWIPLREALTGRTFDGKRVGNTRLLERLTA